MCSNNDVGACACERERVREDVVFDACAFFAVCMYVCVNAWRVCVRVCVFKH